MHLANQSPRKPDKLSQGAHKYTSYPRVQWGNALDKREATDPRAMTTRTTIRKTMNPENPEE